MEEVSSSRKAYHLRATQVKYQEILSQENSPEEKTHCRDTACMTAREWPLESIQDKLLGVWRRVEVLQVCEVGREAGAVGQVRQGRIMQRCSRWSLVRGQVGFCRWGRGCKCGKGTKLSLKSYIAWVTEFIFLLHVDSELSPHARLVWTIPSSACS